jgi:predicted nucleic acid-binding Zn ribbon protein
MLLAPTPFTTICLEVDSVEGAEAPPGAVETLAEFLRTSCGKPVTIVTKKPIPAAEASRSPQFTALLHMRGPVAAASNDSTAYVYVLLYRGRGRWREAGYVRGDYPCAMFIDMAVAEDAARLLIPYELKHEAGHMMMLGANTRHGDGEHCYNSACLMFVTNVYSSMYSGRQEGQLCALCQHDLSEMRQSLQPASVTFKGPFLVRREHGYFVARLPGAVYVGLGQPENFSWQESLGSFRDKLHTMKTNHTDDYARLVSRSDAMLQGSGYYIETRQEYERQQAAISAATTDADPDVRQIAVMIRAKLDVRFGPLPTSAESPPQTPRPRPDASKRPGDL